MAQPQLEKFNRRGLALVEQLMAGVAVPPNPAEDGIRLYDGQSGTEFDTLEENRDRAYFGGNEISTFNHRVFIEGAIHIYPPTEPGGAGTGTPDCDLALRISGMSKTLDAVGDKTTYRPISSDIPMATGDWWHARTKRRAIDARANISALSMEIGNRARAQIRFQGRYSEITEDNLPALPVPEVFGPVIEAANSVMQITQYPGGVAGAPLNVWGKALTVDFGSQLASKEYTEHAETSIDGRQPTFTLRLARTAKADFDPWAVRKAGTFIFASMQVKNSDGRYTKFGLRGQIRDINETDIDGDYGWEITGPCVPTAAGGDEFVIEFGQLP